MIIAIDGPVASGKSTVARRLAQELGIFYLYTGLLYRGIAYILVKQYGYDEARLHHPKESDIDDVLKADRLIYRYENGLPKLLFDGKDITSFLKQGEVDRWSSSSSADPYVRHAILSIQIKIGKEHDVVAEGRDMGTVVFPHADFKFFLTAGLERRAALWRAMQEGLGRTYSIEQSIAEVAERDRRDTTRVHSPLKQAPDAILIDGTNKTIEQIVDEMRKLVLEKR